VIGGLITDLEWIGNVGLAANFEAELEDRTWSAREMGDRQVCPAPTGRCWDQTGPLSPATSQLAGRSLRSRTLRIGRRLPVQVQAHA